MRAYPRERGGTRWIRSAMISSVGLSPRARGNPSGALRSVKSERPIPASAGEPHAEPGAITDVGAYPRERGGTL